jgi:hypothetical protein
VTRRDRARGGVTPRAIVTDARRECHAEPGAMHVIVDNSAGLDAEFADEVARGLRDRQLDVETRAPNPSAKFDTAVHLLASGLVIRVSERPDRELLTAIEEVVRAALQHRSSLRRQTRTVPVYLGESVRAIEWIDVFA